MNIDAAHFQKLLGEFKRHMTPCQMLRIEQARFVLGAHA